MTKKNDRAEDEEVSPHWYGDKEQKQSRGGRGVESRRRLSSSVTSLEGLQPRALGPPSSQLGLHSSHPRTSTSLSGTYIYTLTPVLEQAWVSLWSLKPQEPNYSTDSDFFLSSGHLPSHAWGPDYVTCPCLALPLCTPIHLTHMCTSKRHLIIACHTVFSSHVPLRGTDCRVTSALDKHLWTKGVTL